MKDKVNNLGFTLVELAIVIVIIGLLVGGVLQGQSLIRQSKIQKVVSSAESYKSALNSFKGKYNCLPGDCINANVFFGSTATSCPSLNSNNICNGNLNGRIELDPNFENFQLWRQLGLANFIKGTYSGIQTSGLMVIDGNSPRIFDNVSANIMSFSLTWNMYWSNSNGEGMNHLIFGTINPTTHPDNWQPFLEVNEVYSIDIKIDDGLPGKGEIRVHAPHSLVLKSSLCSSSTDASISTYTLANSGINCNLVYLLNI